MKTTVVVLVAVALVVAPGEARAPMRALARRPARAGSSLAPAEVYTALRNRALPFKPQQRGLKVSPGATAPFGILMETGYPRAVVTLTAFATGDASLYFSTGGGGVIGGVGHATVRAAARRFVTASQPFLSRMEKPTAFPPPAVERRRSG
jgi:hypothetical protein